MRVMIVAAFAAALALPVGAGAHGAGGVHARGTVKAITPDQVILETRQGEQTFAIGADTTFLRGGEAVRPADVRAGERAVVHARRDGERLRATEVHLAPGSRQRDGTRR